MKKLCWSVFAVVGALAVASVAVAMAAPKPGNYVGPTPQVGSGATDQNGDPTCDPVNSPCQVQFIVLNGGKKMEGLAWVGYANCVKPDGTSMNLSPSSAGPPEPVVRIKRGKFHVHKHGFDTALTTNTSFDIDGKFVSRKKAKGTVSASWTWKDITPLAGTKCQAGPMTFEAKR